MNLREEPSPAPPEPDRLDHRLIELLVADGRRSFADLGREIGLSVPATKRRVDRLRETGVITGFTARLDEAKLGWGIEAFTELRYRGTTGIEEIVETTSSIPEVRSVHAIAGDPDALVRVRVRDVAHLQRVIDGLRRSGPVTGTKTYLVVGSWDRQAGVPG
ncbi:MAG: Lrp/AsnC family transcriptional regulator [Pseudonocardia sp.]|nr:Lrp/AsnC family transcriptional regulator [Pseudonocardia sp.]